MNDQHLAKLDRSHHGRHGHPPIELAVSIYRDLSSFWHRVISSFDVDSGPAAFGNRAHEALARIEVDQTTAAVGVVGFCSAVVVRSVDDQLGIAEELSRSRVSFEDAVDSVGGVQFLAVPCKFL